MVNRYWIWISDFRKKKEDVCFMDINKVIFLLKKKICVKDNELNIDCWFLYKMIGG